jgi:hypothetical protein
MLEVFGAVAVGHAAGTATGAACVAAGLALLSYAACARERAAAAAAAAAATTPGGGAGGLGARLLPHQVQAPPPTPPRAAWPAANALLTFTMLLLAVRAASPDPGPPLARGFPPGCSRLQGCARAATSEPHRAGREAPLRIRTTLEGASAAVEGWLKGHGARAEVVYSGPDSAPGAPRGARLVHARVVTPLWGFAGGRRGPRVAAAGRERALG